MGGRGTFAKGKSVDFTYETVGTIGNAKILRGLNGKHSLPEEAHSPNAIYIKLRGDGTLHEMRIYDADRYLVQEIAYHREPHMGKGGDKYGNILHIHDYPERDNFDKRPARLLTPEEISLYKKYLKGVKLP